MTANTPVEFLDAFDVIVVGAGHSGCEAALATARLGCRTRVSQSKVQSILK